LKDIITLGFVGKGLSQFKDFRTGYSWCRAPFTIHHTGAASRWGQSEISGLVLAACVCHPDYRIELEGPFGYETGADVIAISRTPLAATWAPALPILDTYTQLGHAIGQALFQASPLGRERRGANHNRFRLTAGWNQQKKMAIQHLTRKGDRQQRPQDNCRLNAGSKVLSHSGSSPLCSLSGNF